MNWVIPSSPIVGVVEPEMQPTDLSCLAFHARLDRVVGKPETCDGLMVSRPYDHSIREYLSAISVSTKTQGFNSMNQDSKFCIPEVKREINWKLAPRSGIVSCCLSPVILMTSDTGGGALCAVEDRPSLEIRELTQACDLLAQYKDNLGFLEIPRPQHRSIQYVFQR